MKMPPSRKQDFNWKRRLSYDLSNSFPSATLTQAFEDVKMEDIDLSSSCFGAIRIEKGPLDDDELKPLTWLHSTDLLKDINLDDDADYEDEDIISKENCDNGLINFNNQTNNNSIDSNDPIKQVNSKPPFSFSCLIFMAIEDSPTKRLPVKDIYQWILDHFPYFHSAPTGWKNSVRHNLSLNKCFKKVKKVKGQTLGKGSLWCVDPEYRPNLMQALRKTPYHPYHYAVPYSPYTHHAPLTAISSMPNRFHIIPAFHGQAFPSHLALVERILSGRMDRNLHDHGIDPEVEVDAAATMMMFKTRPEDRLEQHDRLTSPHRALSMKTPLSNSIVLPNGLVLMNAKLGAIERKPTLSDLADMALTESYRRRSGNPDNCIPSPAPAEDHTYSIGSAVRRAIPSAALPTEKGYTASEEDPMESDISDFESVGTESEMEDEDESCGLGDSGYGCGFRGELKVRLPIKKRTVSGSPVAMQTADSAAVEGADLLLNLAGVTRTITPPNQITAR
ncbi:forkhead box protein N2-like [Antedon mediterranea]|uniref:forkhead box protein N2-like n=1 Tax=Antedon mediterranea TaxID=105859 RepID=UPI003AF6E357